MAVTPVEFLNHAKRLIDSSNHPPEIDRRSAVSRAYYALFHVASKFLKDRGHYLDTDSGKSHENVKETLTDFYSEEVGLDFDSYRDDRVTADYHLGETFYNRVDSMGKIYGIESLIRKINEEL